MTVRQTNSPATPLEPFHSLCQLRSTLEAFAATRLINNPHREKVMQSLRDQLAILRKHAGLGDYEAFHAEDMELHRKMVASAGLAPLSECWEQASKTVDEAILGLKRSYWPSLMALYREHVYLLDAWQSDDIKAVEQATHHHLEVGWYRLQISVGSAPPEGDAVDRVAAFLSTHYAGRIDMKWVALNIGFVSPGHLTRKFRAQFGSAPYAWLRNLRMERAAQLLSTSSEGVVKIGTMVGYKNASHFTRDFRARFSVTPKQYRPADSTGSPPPKCSVSGIGVF